MTYASPAFFYALPLYLKKDLENVEKRALSIICPGLAYRKALELSNIMSINDYIASLCKKTFLSIANDPAHRLHNMLQSSGPSCYNLRCKRRFAIPKCKTERFKNSFLVRSCIDNEFQRSVSFVNEIDDVVYILTVLSFFIFIGCYYLFRTLSLSFYYTHYCKILLYYIIYYIVNTQFSLVAASFLQINYLSIYLSN